MKKLFCPNHLKAKLIITLLCGVLSMGSNAQTVNCSGGAASLLKFDWSTITYTAGTSTQIISQPAGGNPINFTFSYSDNISTFSSATGFCGGSVAPVNCADFTPNTGGISGSGNQLTFFVDGPASATFANSVVTNTITLSRPLRDYRFSLSDIDNSFNAGGTSNRIDDVRVRGFYKGVAVRPVGQLVATAATATYVLNNSFSVTQIQALGKPLTAASGSGPTENFGTLDVFFNSPVDVIEIEYAEANGTVGDNPAVRGISLGSMFYCTAAINISGTIFNDPNGLLDSPVNTVDGTGTNVSGTIYAILYDVTTGVVAATTAVLNNGTYSFTNNVPGQNYAVYISTVNPLVGQTATPTVILPAGYVHTGESNTAGTGSDGTPNGVYNLGIVNSTITNINFGIEQLPTAGAGVNSAVNPGGTTQVTVPANTFTNTTTSSDPTLVTAIRITAFPTGATSIVIGGVSYTTLAAIQTAYPNGIPTNASGQPIPTITIDPTANGTTSVVISFKAVDAAGKESANTGTAVLNLSAINISGNVFNDANGLLGSPVNTVDGTGTNGGGLNAVLVDNATGLVVSSVAVSATGTYAFGTQVSGSYSVRITTATATVGSAPPAVTLPTGYINTGENNCVNSAGCTGNDGTVNGIINLGTVSTSITQVNFGIEQPPTAGAGVNSAVNPGGITQVSVPANTFTNTTASSDPNLVTGIRITTFPTGATTIVIGGVSFTTLAAIQTAYPNGIPTDASGQPTPTITVDPTANGTTTVTISFVAIDAAGKESANTGSAVLNLSAINISGNVFNDANGLLGSPVNTVDGTGTNGGGLNAVLVDNATGFVVTSVAVSATGTYAFGTQLSGSYSLRITTATATVGALPPAVLLPTGYVSTGENNCVNTAGCTGNDGTVNGIINLGSVSTSITQVNFGIERLPTSTPQSYTITTPVGGSFLTLNGTGATNSPGPLSGSDPEDQPAAGSLSGKNLIINTLPTNGNQLFYNGVQITVTNFSIANYNPTLLRIRFTGTGSTSTSFTYRYIDVAGNSSSSAGLYSIDWTTVLPVKIESFTADLNGNVVQLNWVVANEINLDKYEVMYSVDGTSFTLVHAQAATGSRNYGYVHSTTSPGVNYYQLRSLDIDGKVSLSDIRKVTFGKHSGVQIYPNPASSIINLRFDGDLLNKSAKINVFAADGRLVMQSQIARTSQTQSINIRNLFTGMYVVSITTAEGRVVTTKIQVIK